MTFTLLALGTTQPSNSSTISHPLEKTPTQYALKMQMT